MTAGLNPSSTSTLKSQHLFFVGASQQGLSCVHRGSISQLPHRLPRTAGANTCCRTPGSPRWGPLHNLPPLASSFSLGVGFPPQLLPSPPHLAIPTGAHLPNEQPGFMPLPLSAPVLSHSFSQV